MLYNFNEDYNFNFTFVFCNMLSFIKKNKLVPKINKNLKPFFLQIFSLFKIILQALRM